MRKIILFAIMVMSVVGIDAQTAKSVLDKTAANISNKGGIKANFTISNGTGGTMSGTIAVKGKKFTATTSAATVWFDGKTQWTYMKGNNEVNVNTPSESELQAINPYNFINMYRSGYKLSMTTQEKQYTVHLTATKKRQVSQMYILVDKSTHLPTKVSMLQGKKWTVISVSNMKKASLSDNIFKFNAKDFPQAEVIDLR